MRRGRLRTILQDLPIFLSLNTANIWPELWLPAWDELVVRPGPGRASVASQFISGFYKKDWLGCLSFLPPAGIPEFDKKGSCGRFDQSVPVVEGGRGGGGGRGREGSEVKTGRAGHYYFALWHLTTSPCTSETGENLMSPWQQSTLCLLPSTTDPLFVTTYMCSVL